MIVYSPNTPTLCSVPTCEARGEYHHPEVAKGCGAWLCAEHAKPVPPGRCAWCELVLTAPSLTYEPPKTILGSPKAPKGVA